MKYFLWFFSIFLFLSTPAFAQQSVNPEQVKLNLILQMAEDGFLSEKMTKEAQTAYINQEKLKTYSPTSSPVAETNKWTDYLSLFNFGKVVAVILFLVCFSGIIKKIVAKLWFVVVKVPVIVYQGLFMTGTLIATFTPHLIWSNHSFYIALFGAFANLIVLGWIVSTYRKVQYWFAKIFNIGVPVETVASFWAMVYFAGLAFLYNSQIFGFFAVVSLSSILSFSLYYTGGTLWLYFKDNRLGAVVFGHLVILVAYIGLDMTGQFSTQIALFETGLKFYCTIALCTGLIWGSAPWGSSKGVAFYSVLMLMTFIAGVIGYHLLDLKAIGTIIICFFIIFALDWIAYIGSRCGFIVGTGIAGAVLYGSIDALERYGPQIMNNMAV